MLIIATPLRGAELSTAHVTAGYMDFRVKAALSGVAGGAVTYSLDVVRGRNRIVGASLAEPDITHVLWVDDDNYPARGVDVVREMLVLAGEDKIVAAPYTNKVRPIHWTHRVSPDGAVLGVGFGFTLTPMVVIRRMCESARWYIDLPRGLRCPNLFGQLFDIMTDQQGCEVDVLLSEDYSFCNRARAVGVEIALHLGAGLIHHAGGHVWDAREIHEKP